jgi:hypothetical protein
MVYSSCAACFQAGLTAFASAVPRAEGTFSGPYAANTLWGFAAFDHHPGMLSTVVGQRTGKALLRFLTR